MEGQSRKWMILVATIWIQAFTGTNFDFSAYSSDLKSVLGISQVQLNYLAVASDLGKFFGWSSGLALMYFPLWVVLFMAAFMGSRRLWSSVACYKEHNLNALYPGMSSFLLYLTWHLFKAI
ncbi:hypothetical protein OIU84_004258 [Salix udensis]|uniref:Nodulin-like domain-containing protein n=1 Tax=Salix udensis TaxID=889485 RepID=A0AAD6K260_9ROSI|nr:hypothetical protein OIU84_004258 [Salix udensis]